MQGPHCTNPHTVRRPQATQMNRILYLFSLFLQGHGQEICSILSLTKGWRLVCDLPSQTLLEAYWGCFILVDPFLRLGAPMRKVKVAILSFIFYILPIAPTYPQDAQKDSLRVESIGTHFWKGREGRVSCAQALCTTDTTAFPSIIIS